MEQDIINIIKQYKELLDNGALSQEEFDAKKRQLLAGNVDDDRLSDVSAVNEPDGTNYQKDSQERVEVKRETLKTPTSRISNFISSFDSMKALPWLATAILCLIASLILTGHSWLTVIILIIVIALIVYIHWRRRQDNNSLKEVIKSILADKGIKKYSYHILSLLVVVIISVLIAANNPTSEVIDEVEFNNDATTTTTTTAISIPTQSEYQFKENCSIVSYDSLARNPDAYKYRAVYFSGSVIQVAEDGNDVIMRVNINGDYNQTVLCSYTRDDDEKRTLEGDYITVYGYAGGLYTYESTFGTSVTLPYISAKYIER